ncbi:MAG: IscS subfamily cysteine desulfurase [Planctomycetota bacterium]
MAVKTPIYMDYNATTPVDPRALDTMLPFLREQFGNAASELHTFGQQARQGVEDAREQVAELINADPREIVFTSGATESDNLAIKGVFENYREKGNHIVTSRTEHKAVIDVCEYLETQGAEVTWLTPDSSGVISADQVAEAITDRTILVSVMSANNETGTLNPVARIGAVAKERGVLFHCDATQSVGKLPTDVDSMGIDLLSISAHKIYGPKGVGCLYVRRKDPAVRLAIQMHGGGHERNRRSGTLNVPGIVGFGAACDIAADRMHDEAARLAGLRDRLHSGIVAEVEDVHLNGHPDARLPNTLNLSFQYIEAEALITRLRDLAVATGSACTTASHESSHVLEAMGFDHRRAQGSIRFSIGRFTTEEEIDHAVSLIAKPVHLLRELSPFYEEASSQQCGPEGCCPGGGCSAG